jgi:Family of unknown function (DUF6516)
MPVRDPSLDNLLDLHGQVLVIDSTGYWVKFAVHHVAVTEQKPHGLDYSFTMHAPYGTRLVGFDNAHPVKGNRIVGHDHKHRLRTVKPYAYRDAASLVADFWVEVEAIMREQGVWS